MGIHSTHTLGDLAHKVVAVLLVCLNDVHAIGKKADGRVPLSVVYNIRQYEVACDWFPASQRLYKWI